MAFTINDFQSRISSGVRPNLFKVTINPPTAASVIKTTQTDALTYLCKSAALPASNMGTIEVPFRGRNLKIPGDRTFAAWSATFFNDSKFEARTFFESWMNVVNKMDSNVGQTDPIQIFTDITVDQLSKTAPATGGTTSTADLPVIRTYKLFGAWPSAVSQISLGFDTNNSIEEFTVDFQYQYFNITGGTSPDIK